MPTKTDTSFDCVAMKRRGARALRQTLQDMTPEEQRAFWRERTQALRQQQTEVRKADEDAR